MAEGSERTATGTAHPNIAFIKYWGNRDEQLRLPANGSISMNLAGLTSTTRVTFDPRLSADRLTLNGAMVKGAGLQRAADLVERIRRLAGLPWRVEIDSRNNFPTGAGIASSASGFAALTVAAACAAGLQLDEWQLSRLARTASGSACRSIPSGFVEWPAVDADGRFLEDEHCFAQSIASAEHWDLTDCIAIVSRAHKAMVSQDGHALASTSPLQAARTASSLARLQICRGAIMQHDFEALAQVMELDSNLMHAVIMTGSPPIIYWQPETLAVMQAVVAWRRSGLPVAYTIDAGPNVHAICPASEAVEVTRRLHEIEGVQDVYRAGPGPAARCVTDESAAGSSAAYESAMG